MKRPSSLLVSLCFATMLASPSASSSQKSDSSPSKTALGFTAAQAAAGKGAYDRSCSSCHGSALEGEAIAPSLTGKRFAVQWAGKPAALLLGELRQMPLPPVAEPGSLSEETYLDILAYLLQESGLPPGDTPLPRAAANLATLTIPHAPGAETKAATSSASDANPSIPSTKSRRLLSELPTVTDDTLSAPAAEDWPIARRSYHGLGFSPLDQIDRGNVSRLALAWRTPLEPGESMPAPLVHHGVMYLHTYPDTTLALDAATGAVLWRHRYDSSTPSSKKMGVALYRDRVFVPTSDLHLLALDARTGELIWDHEITTESPKSELYQLRSAPLVVGDRVLQGMMSFQVPRGGFVVAVDIDNGKEAWRFNTVARPGQVGGDTWNDLPLDQRNGGSVWVTGSYDPELDLVYFGPAPTYDTAPLMHRVDRPGVNNDALFTNATVALRPKTGELAWYYQHMPNDQWDLDWAFERQILDLPIDGKTRKVVITVGKSAIVEAMDAATGEYLFSIDLGLQNVIQSIDPKTGTKTIRPESAPSVTENVLICPTAVGARSWPNTSYNPATKMLFLPLTEGCMTGGPEGFKGLLTSGVGLTMSPHPDSSDGNMGRLQAVHLERRQLAWSFRQPTPLVSSTLATAGGLVFVGDLEPSLQAFDDRSGERLWQAELDDLPGSSLITYAVDGRQYLTVVVGQPNNVSRDWSRIYRGFAAERGEVIGAPPEGGAAIWTFAVP